MHIASHVKIQEEFVILRQIVIVGTMIPNTAQRQRRIAVYLELTFQVGE